VNDLYVIKSTTKGSVKAISKLNLNSPLGRFGLSIDKPITDIVDKKKLDLLLSTCETQWEMLSKDQYLVTYQPAISKKICEQSGLDYIKLLNKYKVDLENIDRFQDVSISTASAITSYARIYMNRIKLLILSLGGNIYYMETV
jgi:hypothetical protein